LAFNGNDPVNDIDPLGLLIRAPSKCIESYLKRYLFSVDSYQLGTDWYFDSASGRMGDPVISEILDGMINSAYWFKLRERGNGGCLGALLEHLDARQRVLLNVASVRYDFGTGAKVFVPTKAAPKGAKPIVVGASEEGPEWTKRFPCVNSPDTEVACEYGSALPFFDATGKWHGNYAIRDLEQPTGPPGPGRPGVVGGSRIWIPGDRGGFINVQQTEPQTGEEGENVIYLGAGEFWGHGGGTRTEEEWFREIDGWDNGRGIPWTRPFVEFPTNGLSNESLQE
jgi:hypothetical protein